MRYNSFSSTITFAVAFQENRFTKCDICTMIKSEKEKSLDATRIADLNDLMEEHLKLQM